MLCVTEVWEQGQCRQTVKTPWGLADTVVTLGEVAEPDSLTYQVLSVATPSHGGIYVPRELLHHIPENRRAYAKRWSQSECWYEEDCAWAAVCLAFPQLFPLDAHAQAEAIVARYIDKDAVN